MGSNPLNILNQQELWFSIAPNMLKHAYFSTIHKVIKVSLGFFHRIVMSMKDILWTMTTNHGDTK